ncbi:MAG TPA: hypothetical protein VEL74_02565 [Thermoanaerobaculia bacterium]|nr:hypothetical protein [Thermoanaerobaculia bacterium]
MMQAFRTKAVLFSLACLLTATALFLPHSSEASVRQCLRHLEYCTYSTGGFCRDDCVRGHVCRLDVSGEVVSCTVTTVDCCAGGA